MAKKHNLSPNQDAAANPQNNVWVQANAGTGKTSVLVQRLLRILFRSEPTNNGILCLTYTNAGAGEMRNRILAALQDWAALPDTDLIELLDGITINQPVTTSDAMHTREIFFKYIDCPDMLKIKTIHGFCEEILRRFPIEAGVSPSWSLVSDTAQRILLQETFNKLINSPSTDTKIHTAFAHIVQNISETYLDDLLDILSNQYKHFFDINNIITYREYFIDTIGKLLELQTTKPMPHNTTSLKNIIEIATNEQNNSKKPTQYLNQIIDLTQKYIDTTIDFDEYKTAYLTDTGTKKSTVSKKDYLIAEQDRVYKTDQHNKNNKIFLDTMALFDLSAAFASEYKAQKHAKNLLDFEDLILYTRKLFSNPTTMGWVLSQLDISLSHILVDEAQDTSPLQWDIMRMLAGDFFTDGTNTQNNRSLFVVGDTKQSIYGFQGADPNAFMSSRDIISAQITNNLRTIQEIPLDQSFRSTLPILHTVDTFFNDQNTISISSFHNNNHKCFRQNARGLVEIHKLISKQEHETTTNQYIKHIATKIQDLITSKKYTASDIMILVQNRNPLSTPLIKELKKHNIPVAGNDRIVLPDFPAIRDILNLIRWCINPNDDYSLCCVLRSPFFNLNLDNIFNLCTARNKNKITLEQQLELDFPDIFAQLNDIKSISQKSGPYTLFSQIFNTNNTRQKFISALGDQIIDPLDEFMTICLSYERTQSGTIRHFLKWFITGSSEIKRDLDSSSGVKIVTVHGSKGLEAPVVFLIDTVRTPKKETITPIKSDNLSTPIWLWTPQGTNTDEFNKITQTHTNERIAEYYRLLYVAMTRARDELYIYGYTPHKSAPENSWHTQLWNTLSKKQPDSDCIRITNDNIE